MTNLIIPSLSLPIRMTIIWVIIGSTVSPCSGQQDVHMSNVLMVAETQVDSPAVAVGPNGEMHVVWEDRNQGQDIFYRRSLDYGASLQAPVRLSSADGVPGGAPRITADREGHVYVRWLDVHPGSVLSIQFTSSSNSGLTWLQPELQLSHDDSRDSTTYAMGVDDGGIVYVAYRDAIFEPTFEFGTWFRRSTDAGLTFSPPASVESEGAWSGPQHIVADGTGSVYLATIRSRSVPDGYYVQRSLDFGEAWSTAVTVDPSQVIGPSRRLGCSVGGVVYAVWADSRNGFDDVYFARSIDYGQTFEPSARLDSGTAPGTADSTRVAMANDSAGNVYVTWMEWDDPRIRVSHDFGATWSVESSLTVPGITGFEGAQIAANESGHVAVLWQSLEPGSSGLRLNRSRDFGATWSLPPIRVDSPGDHPQGHAIDMDSSGRAFAAWLEEIDIDDLLYHHAYARGIFPTLAMSAVPRDDGDGLVVIPPEGDRLNIPITLQNHHPTDPLTALSAWLEVVLPDGRTIGPIVGPKTLANFPAGASRRATFRGRFPARMAAGLYFFTVRTNGPIEDRVQVPILKR